MTNLTKQEIQEYREWLADADVRFFKWGTTLGKALDIAEKHVWLPISELPRKINGDVFLMYATHDAGGYCFVGTINIVGDITSMMRGEKEDPTHYMPLPTPPHV